MSDAAEAHAREALLMALDLASSERTLAGAQKCVAETLEEDSEVAPVEHSIIVFPCRRWLSALFIIEGEIRAVQVRI